MALHLISFGLLLHQINVLVKSETKVSTVAAVRAMRKSPTSVTGLVETAAEVTGMTAPFLGCVPRQLGVQWNEFMNLGMKPFTNIFSLLSITVVERLSFVERFSRCWCCEFCTNKTRPGPCAGHCGAGWTTSHYGAETQPLIQPIPTFPWQWLDGCSQSLSVEQSHSHPKVSMSLDESWLRYFTALPTV